jgi:hypothetical protein
MTKPMRSTLGRMTDLTKPFSFLVLLARLRALIRRGAPERPVTLAVGSLRLDPATRDVTRDGQVIALAAREFGLLDYLMRRTDEVLSKAQILDNVWDPDFRAAEIPRPPKLGATFKNHKLFTSCPWQHAPRGSASKVPSTAAAGASIVPYPGGRGCSGAAWAYDSGEW